MPTLQLAVSVWIVIQFAQCQLLCPSETDTMIGYRKGDTCYTIGEFPWEITNERMAKSPHQAARRACKILFKQGDRHGFFDEKGLETDASWRENINGEDIWAFGHFFILRTSKVKELPTGQKCQDMDILKDRKVLKKSRCYKTVGSKIIPTGDDPLLKSLTEEHHYDLTSMEAPLCLTYLLSKKGIKNSHLKPCKEYFQQTGEKPKKILCKHKPYKGCQWESVNVCNYVSKENKWYSSMQVIKDKGERPYGARCPIKSPSDLGSTCIPKCKGVWGAWTEGPKEEHLRCDYVTVSRYKPLNKGSFPCLEISGTCCPEVKVITYNVSCADFAYNSTINLKQKGCQNGGTLGTDAYGHAACHCTDEYDGVECERDICKDACINGGTCMASVGKVTCLCKKGYTGSKCEDFMESCGPGKECKNGGTCKEMFLRTNKKVGICACLPAYGGPYCESLAASNCTDESCQFGGECIYDVVYSTIKCICFEGYTGPKCDPIADQTKEKIKEAAGIAIYLIAGIGVGFAALILIFGGTAVHHHRRRLRKRRFKLERDTSAASSSYASSFSTALSIGRSTQRRTHMERSTAEDSTAPRGKPKKHTKKKAKH